MTAADRASRFDVAVVGYGPTGATLANLLALCGLEVLVLEREAAIYDLPRAVHFDDETMRVFQTVGIAGALGDSIRVNPGMRFVDADGTLLMDWPRPQEVGPQGWHPSYRFHQPTLEARLREALAARPNATVRTQAELGGLEDRGDRVAISYRDRASGAVRSAEAKFLVGCDGARSTVREVIGGGMEDLGFAERWLVVDLLLRRPRPDLGDHTVQFCDPARPMTYCRNPGDRRRWEIAVLDHESAEDIARPERVWELIAPRIGPDDATLERSAVYTFRSAIAARWRRGRLLIAGDAAHLTPPFMGQGMCAGIRDAANLAWKLALCARGRADEALLDSYRDERGPHVREYIATAVRLGKLVHSLDREGALAMAQDRAEGRATMASIAPRLGPSAAAAFGAPASPDRGRLFGQPRLSDGRLMDDACGYRSVLVARRPPAGMPDPARGGGPALVDAETHPGAAPFLDELGAEAVLIRPDRYVLATAQSDAETAALAEIDLPSPLAGAGRASDDAA